MTILPFYPLVQNVDKEHDQSLFYFSQQYAEKSTQLPRSVAQK